MEYKQVIAVRVDLDMGKGKLAAQVAHAAVEAVLRVLESSNSEWKRWLTEWRRSGQKKIVVRARDEKHLLDLYVEAKKLGLPVVIITDAGLTQLPPGTKTAIAIGPAPSSIIDRVTGKLKLL